jgi:Tfp pilus assembly PilM family ATPase
MGRKNESITGMAVTADAICLARLITEDRQIANISIQPVEERTGNIWESAEAGLKQLVGAIKLRNENVVCSLPGEHAIIRKFIVDNDEPDLKETLEWEFSRHIIGQSDEFSVDFEEIPSAAGNTHRQFLMAGYRIEAIESLRNLTKSGKLNPVIFDLDVFAIINAYEANYRDTSLNPAVCIIADYAVSKLVLTIDGRFIDMEIVNSPKDAHNPDSYYMQIEQGISQLLASNPGICVRDSVAVMLSGPLFSMSEFAENIKKSVKNAEILYPFRTVKCGAGMAEEQLRKYSPHLAVAVGLALRGGEQGV